MNRFISSTPNKMRLIHKIMKISRYLRPSFNRPYTAMTKICAIFQLAEIDS